MGLEMLEVILKAVWENRFGVTFEDLVSVRGEG
jgi:hypothetical protein